MHPEIADLLVAKEKMLIIRQDDGTYRTQSEYKAPFLNSNSMASHQGNLKLNFLQWSKFNFQSIAKSHCFFLLSFYLMIKVHWLFSILFIGCLLYIIWYWFMVSNRFMAGDVNPGKVIAINPTFVAVATNMSKFSGDYPILKIIKTTLPKEDNIIGKVIPTVALYNNNPHNYPFWAEFHPVPVIHGISDKKYIESITKNFSYSSDSPLEAALSKVQNRTEGVYKVDEASNDWAKFTHVDIAKGVSMEKPLS